MKGYTESLNNLVVLTYLFRIVGAGLTSLTTDDCTLCNGKPAVIPWSYDNEGNISTIIWSKDATQLMFYSGGSLIVNDNKYELDTATSNAGLKVKTVVSTSADIYSCSVVYHVGTSSPDLKTLDCSGEYIASPPATPTGSCTDQGSSRYLCTCSITDLGNPAATLQIKVDGGTAQTPANAEVTSVQTVECCVEGKSAKCIDPSSPSSLYCVNVSVPGGCSVWLCFIGLIVTVVLCSGKLGLYFCKILVFKRILSIEFGLKIATPSAAICLAGILLGTLLCFLASGCDDEKTWGTAVGVVLVICCPCCSVGIIIIHFKMKNEGNISTATVTGLQEQKNSGNDGDSSCFPRNNSILPICAGTDQQPQPSQGGQGQGGQHTAKGQTKLPPDHGRQKPDGDNGRPLPIPDKDDGLQKSKTEKSGSVVSKGDVDVDEAFQVKPRILPDIPPGGEKNIRGISANFDEVVPNKKRLTPIGKESIEIFEEKSPGKKKKKKKKDKGKDTSVE